MRNEYSNFNLKYKNIFEKLARIEELEKSNCLTAHDLEILDYLSNDENDEVRTKVAEILAFSSSFMAEKILIKLLKDKDELVRVNACDSLCNSTTLEVIDILKNRVIKDKSSLVRGYAALSIADIATNKNFNLEKLSEFFRCALEREKVQWVKINFYKVLYMLGDKSFLNKLINQLNNRLYRNRCAVVNVLSDLISNENFTIIEAALIKRLKVETSIAVKNKIEEVVNNMISD